MTEFPWMESTLRLMTLDELRDSGVAVYQAPKVPKRSLVVNLMNGVVIDFSEEREMPARGSYAKQDEIVALAKRFGLGLTESNRILEAVSEEAGL